MINEKLYFTETDDIRRVMETWLTTYRHWAPREKDVDNIFYSRWIVRKPRMLV